MCLNSLTAIPHLSSLDFITFLMMIIIIIIFFFSFSKFFFRSARIFFLIPQRVVVYLLLRYFKFRCHFVNFISSIFAHTFNCIQILFRWNCNLYQSINLNGLCLYCTMYIQLKCGSNDENDDDIQWFLQLLRFRWKTKIQRFIIKFCTQFYTVKADTDFNSIATMRVIQCKTIQTYIVWNSATDIDPKKKLWTINVKWRY